MSTAVTACPHCATSNEQPLVCDRCGWRWYANPKPAAAVLLERTGANGETEPDPAAAPGRRARARRSGICRPGYLDPGESFEMAARRETREESGIEVELRRS